MIDFGRSKEYTLSIRLSADGFCFSAHHPRRADEFAFMPYEVNPSLPIPANLKQAKESLQMLQPTYGRVQVLFVDEPWTLIPTELYASESGRALYEENFPQTTERQQLVERRMPTGQTLLFTIDKSTQKWVDNFFPGAVMSHAMEPVLHYALRAEADIFLCNLHERALDIVCVRQGKLVFANSFANDAVENATYYLLNVWQTLGLSQTDDVLTLTGKGSAVRDLRSSLKRFVRHIEVLNPATTFHASELARIDSVPFDLQALTGMAADNEAE